MDQNNGVTDAINVIAGNGSSEVVLYNGDKVRVSVCNGRSLPKILDFLSILSKDLGLKLKDTDGIEQQLLRKFEDVSFALQLISNYTDRTYGLIVEMSSLENVAAVEALAIDDLAKVTIRVIEVNRDFFTSRLKPLIMAMIATGKLG